MPKDQKAKSAPADVIGNAVCVMKIARARSRKMHLKPEKNMPARAD
jgi:hypothetical protein